MAENALNLLPLLRVGFIQKQKNTIQYSPLRLSSFLNIYIQGSLCLCYILFFEGAVGLAQCSSVIIFDLEIFKSVHINPEMQIIDPEDCCGALKSECSYDAVKFKRIIMVLGNENWNCSQAGSSLKYFRMPPKSKDLWFHCLDIAEQSVFWIHVIAIIPIQIHLIKSAFACSTEIVSGKLKKWLVRFQASSATIKHFEMI